MKIKVLASQVSDNFFVALYKGTRAWLIDPIDALQAHTWLVQNGLSLDKILNTHWHPDHVGGNAELLKHYPDASVLASRTELEAFERVTGQPPTQLLDPGDTIELDGRSLDVVSIPGHTHGHLAFVMGHHFFGGDVLFRGGSGHCRFGGDPGVLFATYRDVLRKLDTATILYPGHDYTHKNLALSHHILPSDADVLQAYNAAKLETPRTFYPARIEDELRSNLFLRYDDPTLQNALKTRFAQCFETQLKLSQCADEASWRTLRDLRDRWQNDGTFS